MKFGVFLFATDETIDPVALATAVEERGFESLFLPEHTHIPVSRRTPWPGGGELPREYYRSLDPFVALAAAASVTERLRLGTGVCLVAQRDPLILAKEVATLDHLSRGRLLLGVGAGWNREEIANHGTDPRTRTAVLRERVLAMRAIWAHDEAEFHGEHVDFEPVYSWPKPFRRPHPPILVGGNGPTTLERVVEYGDGWFPIVPRDRIEAFGLRVAELQRWAEERGRSPLPVSVYGASPRPDAIERFAGLGVERCVLPLPPAGAAEVLATLDRRAELVAAYPD